VPYFLFSIITLSSQVAILDFLTDLEEIPSIAGIQEHSLHFAGNY
jgi:hypothetical protein